MVFGALASFAAPLVGGLSGGGSGGGGLPGIGSLGGQPGVTTSGPAIAEGDTINISRGGGLFAAFGTLSRREPLAGAAVMVALIVSVVLVFKVLFGKGR
jgi:hypothetical protein